MQALDVYRPLQIYVIQSIELMRLVFFPTPPMQGVMLRLWSSSTSVDSVLLQVRASHLLEPTGLAVPLSPHVNASLWWLLNVAFGT
jgi:hypothetical protein